MFLAVVGIKLPGLEFRNQRVEAAYRKELVYGEDHADRAQPPTVAELFANVRKNYFRLYFHYLYFNIARYFLSLQTDNLFSLLVLIPSIVAGEDDAGYPQQISNVFDQVRSSFQYLDQFLDDDRRADVDLQASEGFRGHDRRRAAADDRPALSPA